MTTRKEQANITPALATEWLAMTPEKQRDINDKNVAKIQKAIENGDWHYNGQPIIFDQNNQLVDGQHRLMAIVRSGKSVISDVTWGVSSSDETFHTIDDSRPRVINDFLHCPNKNHVSAVAIILRSVLAGEGYLPNAKAPTVEVRRAIDPYVDRLQPILGEVDRAGRAVGMGSFLAFLLLYHRHIVPVRDQERLKEFFIRLGDGAALLPGDPILALRNQLMQVGRHTIKKRTNFRALVVKALTAFMNGDEVKRLNWAQGKEGLPMLYSDYAKKARRA
jgi:hypothetical protein